MHYLSYSSILRTHHPLVSSLVDPLYSTSCGYCGIEISSYPALKLKDFSNPYERATMLKNYLDIRLFCSSCLASDLKTNVTSKTLTCDYCGEHLIESDPCPCQYAKKFNDNLRYRSLFIYNKPIRKLIFNVKFNTSKDLCNWLALSLFTQVPKLYESALAPSRTCWDILSYVPSKIENIRNRGSYSTRYIAKSISKLLGDIPLIEFKNISNERQSSLKVKERIHTNNKFTYDPMHSLQRARSAILLDDMLTTGSSSFEVANLLFNKGIKRVDILTIARSPDFRKNYMKFLSS